MSTWLVRNLRATLANDYTGFLNCVRVRHLNAVVELLETIDAEHVFRVDAWVGAQVCLARDCIDAGMLQLWRLLLLVKRGASAI